MGNLLCPESMRQNRCEGPDVLEVDSPWKRRDQGEIRSRSGCLLQGGVTSGHSGVGEDGAPYGLHCAPDKEATELLGSSMLGGEPTRAQALPRLRGSWKNLP
ncbi:uncharacterized [Tachysurus ichikawai]